MTTKTEPTAAELDAEFQRLSFAVTQGDTVAAVKLAKIEERIEDAQRAERRKVAAAAEHQRLLAEAEKQAEADAHAKAVADYEVALEAKTRAFSLVEQVVEELIAAVKLAVLEGNEAHAAALRLGYSPGILASSQIATFIAWKLGRDGEGTAGLSDMAPVFAPMRVNLVTPPHKES